MSDNVLKFRQPERKPEPKAPKPGGEWPRWLPFAVLIVLALGIYFVRNGLG